MKFTYDELIDAIRDNLANMSYDDVASVFNYTVGFVGGRKVSVEYPYDADEPLFVEEGEMI